MKVLVVLCAALALAAGNPAVGYAYSAYSPVVGYPYAPYAAPLAYSAAAPVLPAVAPYAAVAPAPVPVPAPVVPAAGVKSQYHSQDELGQASYGHTEPGQTHNAVQDAAGNKVGSFSFVNLEGKVVRTDYVADAGGYRVASNDLPVASLAVPLPPADTPEVAAAKAAHFAEVAKARSKRAVIAAPAAYHPYAAYPYAAYPYAAPAYPSAYPHAYPTTHTVPVVTHDGYIADTPEVAHAKAAHFAEHAAARSRSKRAAFYTPAATTPLAAVSPYVAPYSPIAYPYSAYPYSAYPYAFYK